MNMGDEHGLRKRFEILAWEYAHYKHIFTQIYHNNLYLMQKLISNLWGKHKGNQYHGDNFIPDKTYWRQKEY